MQYGYGQQPGYPPQQALPPQGYGPPAGAAGYEFTPEQEQKIGSLGNRLIFSGVLQIVWGLGQGTSSWVFGLGQWLYNAPISLALLIMGIMLCLTGSSFKRIRETQGNDIGHLMEAIGKLSLATVIQIVGFIFAMLLGMAVLILVFVIGAIALASS
jgi:hypothetical protein